MSRVPIALASLVAGLVLAVPAAAAQTVTAAGIAQAKVTPKNRKSEASIEAAVEAAHKAGIASALSDAHEYASLYAQAAGLTLGSVMSVTDVPSNGPGYYFGFPGPFGPNQYCGDTVQPVFKTVNGKRKLARLKHVHTCFVPPFEPVSLTVTYSAT